MVGLSERSAFNSDVPQARGVVLRGLLPVGRERTPWVRSAVPAVAPVRCTADPGPAVTGRNRMSRRTPPPVRLERRQTVRRCPCGHCGGCQTVPVAACRGHAKPGASGGTDPAASRVPSAHRGPVYERGKHGSAVDLRLHNGEGAQPQTDPQRRHWGWHRPWPGEPCGLSAVREVVGVRNRPIQQKTRQLSLTGLSRWSRRSDLN